MDYIVAGFLAPNGRGSRTLRLWKPRSGVVGRLDAAAGRPVGLATRRLIAMERRARDACARARPALRHTDNGAVRPSHLGIVARPNEQVRAPVSSCSCAG